MTRAGLYVGIDLGTTVLKVAAFDARSGRVRAIAGERLKVRVTPDGGREQDPSALAQALRRAAGALRARLGARWASAAGVGLAAQGGSHGLFDRESGKPLMPMCLWSDQRPSAHLHRVLAERPAGYWPRLSMRASPGMGLAAMLWLRDVRPALFDDANLFGGAGEYLFHQLTGTWRQDAGNALQIGCYHARRRELDAGPLRIPGVPKTFVAPMRRGHETHALSKAGARLLGLTPGIPVAGPYMDHEAGFVSALGASDRPLQCSLGTAWVGNFELPRDASWWNPVQLVLPSMRRDDGWLVVQPLLTGNVTWDWALETFAGLDHAQAIRRVTTWMDARILPAGGLTALPWMNTRNPFKPEAVGGGGFFGVSAQTPREDFVRALAVSMCCEMARVFGALRANGLVDSVVLSGGASKGAAMRACLAALFDPLPVRLLDDQDAAGARGTLYPFLGTRAAARARRVRPPARAAASGIRGAMAVYEAVFDRVMGGNALLKPLTFG
jgi:sugar (pentulose or hexulose) kinase